MGSKISGILAILFMDKLETIALTSHLIISPYKRYVDEIYIQTTNEETADYFHHIINNVHPNLKFELKNQKQHQVSHYIKDSNSSFEFYRKPVKKPLFVHHQSAIPTKSNLNFIHNERKRIENRCSSLISATQHLNKFHDILRLNGYSENSIEQSKHPQHPQRNPQPAKIERSYLKIPFTSKRLSHKITNIFRNETYRYAFPTNPTRSNKPYPTPSKCTNVSETKCPISYTGLCLQQNAVHRLTRNSCNTLVLQRLTRNSYNTLVTRNVSSTTA